MKTTKVVNIYPKAPIVTVNPPIRTAVRNVTKSIEEIRSCLMARATVEEILADGKTIRLDNTNYDKDNSELDEKTEVPVDEKSDFQKAYEEALAGKDLASMTKKERNRAKAAAREAANKAVADKKVEDTVDESKQEITEESVNEVHEESVETEVPVDEAPVVTLDAENINAAE